MTILIGLVVVIGTTIWVGFDHGKIQRLYGDEWISPGPWRWIDGCLLLWIVFFPWYLVSRSRQRKLGLIAVQSTGAHMVGMDRPPPEPPGDTRPNLSQGSGWWEANDGRWYPPVDRRPPPPTDARPPPPKPEREPLKWIALGLVVVVAVSLGIYFATKPPTTSVTSGIPGTAMTVSQFTKDVQTQLVGTGTGNFGVKGVGSVICNPPDRWNAGKTFQCFVFNSSDTTIGYYDGTVTPNNAYGGPQWVGSWIPAG